MEGASYEVDGITYICQNSEWLQASFRRLEQPLTTFRFAAYSPTTAAACPATDSQFRNILRADGGGAVVGALTGINLGVIGILGGAAIWGLRGSGMMAVGEAFVSVFCAMF